MRSKKTKTNLFLAMWDMYGLECLIDVSKIIDEQQQWEKEKVWNMLKETKNTTVELNIPLNHLIMRARANPQRHYEIYSITTDKSIDYNTMLALFKENPQTAVNLVREKGNKIYSDRATEKAVIV